MKYKLDVKRDVDGNEGDYLLWLPFGFRFSDEVVHVRGFDTIAEIKEAAKRDVVECDCEDCKKNIKELAAKKKEFIKQMLD
jgi:hypothetical protein